MLFYFLRFFIVDTGDVRRCFVGSEDFIQFCVDGLSITMLCPLNEQRHSPREKGGSPMPIQTLPVEENPEERVGQ